jgi:hypothetical protein
MSSLSQAPQPSPLYQRCFWTITSNGNLYVLKNEHVEDRNSRFYYHKLGEVLGVNYSKAWTNELGVKKSVFKVSIQPPPATPGSGPENLDDSFTNVTEGKEVYVVQEHMFTDFVKEPPRFSYLPKGPIQASILTPFCTPDQMQKQGNWLKKGLARMAEPTENAGRSFLNEDVTTPTRAVTNTQVLPSGNTISSTSSGSSVFGGPSANTLPGYESCHDFSGSDSDNAQVTTPGEHSKALLQSQTGTITILFLFILCNIVIILVHIQR